MQHVLRGCSFCKKCPQQPMLQMSLPLSPRARGAPTAKANRIMEKPVSLLCHNECLAWEIEYRQNTQREETERRGVWAGGETSSLPSSRASSVSFCQTNPGQSACVCVSSSGGTQQQHITHYQPQNVHLHGRLPPSLEGHTHLPSFSFLFAGRQHKGEGGRKPPPMCELTCPGSSRCSACASLLRVVCVCARCVCKRERDRKWKWVPCLPKPCMPSFSCPKVESYLLGEGSRCLQQCPRCSLCERII